MMNPLGTLTKLISKGGRGVGVEITPNRISVASLHKRGQQNLKLAKLVQVPILEEGVFQDGQILASPIMTDLLQVLFEEHRINTKRVATSLTGRDTFARLIHVPAELNDRELRDMILNYEAGLYLPFPREEADVDYQKLGFFVDEDGIEKIRVLLAATRRDVSDIYLSTFKEAGMEIDVLEIGSFSLIRSIRSQLQQFTPQEAVAIANIGFESTEIIIVMDGIPHFSRTLPIGTYKVETAISRAMKLPPTRNVDLLQSMTIPTSIDSGGTGPGMRENPGTAAMMQVLGELADELRRSIDFYLNQGENLEVVQLLLAGTGGGIEKLDDFLTQRLNLPTSPVDPIKALSLELDEEIPAVERPGLGVVLGLSLREI